MTVGTEIKRIFERIGIPGCGTCKDMEVVLNERGVEWCERHFDYLIRWFTNQARNHKVSLVRAAISLSVKYPSLTCRIAVLKLRYWRTDLSELAAVAIVDRAIERAKARV